MTIRNDKPHHHEFRVRYSTVEKLMVSVLSGAILTAAGVSLVTWSDVRAIRDKIPDHETRIRALEHVAAQRR